MIKTKVCIFRLFKKYLQSFVPFVLLALLIGMWVLVYWRWSVSELERKLSYVPVAMGIKTVRYSTEPPLPLGEIQVIYPLSLWERARVRAFLLPQRLQQPFQTI